MITRYERILFRFTQAMVEIDEDTITAADYTVLVEQIPSDASDAEEFKAFFSRLSALQFYLSALQFSNTVLFISTVVLFVITIVLLPSTIIHESAL